LRHPPYGFDIYLVNVKIIRRMAQIFVAFSEKLNFIMVRLFEKDEKFEKKSPLLFNMTSNQSEDFFKFLRPSQNI